MNSKVFIGLAALCVFAAVGMYMVGDNSSHMSELKDFFWVPLPLALVLGIAGMKTDAKPAPSDPKPEA